MYYLSIPTGKSINYLPFSYLLVHIHPYTFGEVHKYFHCIYNKMNTVVDKCRVGPSFREPALMKGRLYRQTTSRDKMFFAVRVLSGLPRSAFTTRYSFVQSSWLD